jgi:potassium-dependent mechanosensitive channel
LLCRSSCCSGAKPGRIFANGIGFFGFHIGNTEVTFGAPLASIIVFGVGYATARLFQGWLDPQVLLPARISGGVRNSSIAIVAGALSVGIGFGPAEFGQ